MQQNSKKNNLTADPEIWAWKLQLSNFWKMKSCKIYQLTGTQTDKTITRNMGIRSLSPLYVSFVLDSLLYLYKKSQIPLLTAFWVTLKKWNQTNLQKPFCIACFCILPCRGMLEVFLFKTAFTNHIDFLWFLTYLWLRENMTEKKWQLLIIFCKKDLILL